MYLCIYVIIHHVLRHFLWLYVNYRFSATGMIDTVVNDNKKFHSMKHGCHSSQFFRLAFSGRKLQANYGILYFFSRCSMKKLGMHYFTRSGDLGVVMPCCFPLACYLVDLFSRRRIFAFGDSCGKGRLVHGPTPEWVE